MNLATAVLTLYPPAPAVNLLTDGTSAHPSPRLRLVPRPARKSILLSDDDRSVRELLGRVLESEHYEVVYAKTGREAVARFQAGPPDLVLLDLNMPEQDGWEVFGQICAKDPLVPVIVITARPEQHTQAIELGIDALMEKPLDLPLLLDTIRTLLEETEGARVRRLTAPDYQTVLLHHANGTPPRTSTR